MRIKVTAAGALIVVLASGCAGLHSSQPPTQVYTLEAAATATTGVAVAGAAEAAPSEASEASEASVTVQVLRPLAAPGLDSDRIALLREGSRFDYYAASRWPAPLPDLLQSLAISALRASGQFRAVQPDGAAFATDEVLQLEIRRCQAEYGAGGDAVVRVQLVATLGRRADRRLVASVSAESAVPVAENRLQPVIAAFRAAIADALGQLVARLPQRQ